MKLKSFKATGVYGYINFDFDFHSDISLLVGVNGSGKTTALKLIQALLTPSLRDLLSIDFKLAKLIYEHNGGNISITSQRDEKDLVLQVSELKEVLRITLIDKDEIDYMYSGSKRGEEFFEELQIKYSNDPVFDFITKINVPVFLGLERTYKTDSDLPRDYFYNHERMIVHSQNKGIRARRIIKGTLAAGLNETQFLIQEAYRRFRSIQDTQAVKLRESILLSSFKYTDFSLLGSLGQFPSWMEQRQFLEKKREIETALENIGLSSDEMKKLLADFFQRLDTLFGSVGKSNDSKGHIEWLLNKAQIDRVSNLIEIIDIHKSQMDKAFSPITKFIDSVNSFYKDTQKALTIDSVGQLVVIRPDKKLAAIEALSSGERQLLIMFAHLIFNKYGSRSNIFIIDEPELSLHLRWQEQFIEKAVEVSPKAQLILATHSPEIVGDLKDHCIEL